MMAYAAAFQPEAVAAFPASVSKSPSSPTSSQILFRSVIETGEKFLVIEPILGR